jgi:hypothetical protein
VRAFLVFLIVAGGIVITARESSAQGPGSSPAQVESDGSSIWGAPLGHGFGRRGSLSRGYSTSQSADCGCGEDGACACHGSYKYPVPSQYSYFWPGIYSQQTMTQYVSPWRYPDLNPIPEHWKLDPIGEPSPYSGYRY